MDNLLHSIQSHTLTRFVKKGSILLYQGEIPRTAFIIRRGLVRVYTITTSGEERTIALHGKGDIFPLPWIFGEVTNTLFYYEAMVDSELVTAPKAHILEAVANDPALTAAILKFSINEYTALLLRITALEQSRAAEKIGLTLYYLIFRHSIEKTPGLFTIDIKMTQSMIASLVGLTRESTAVNLKLLKKKGIIQYSKFTYVIDKAKLERFVGEDTFKDLTLK
ncbi:MAG: CarD family transcriptional regulator [Candidatus Saccharibacteria bacterium]|jgi:CRP/FNR family cyclic AMP-dependent transcriptional regulator|nr:CarD family transcriptional regulator [Candidatus Saccharibacteria bacterium]